MNRWAAKYDDCRYDLYRNWLSEKEMAARLADGQTGDDIPGFIELWDIRDVPRGSRPHFRHAQRRRGWLAFPDGERFQIIKVER